MYGPQFLDGVRALARGTGDVAPPLRDAWASVVGARLDKAWASPPGVESVPGILVLRSPPVRWSEHATLAGDRELIAALRAAADRAPLVMPATDPDEPVPASAAELLRGALARSLASLWEDPSADDAFRRDIVSGARAANRLGRRLRALAGDDAGAPGGARRGSAAARRLRRPARSVGAVL